ncbi:MAG: transporter, family, D-galactonate transporter [Sphingomonadales bacterium]|nr:transporter, family, D-galactonate transporter [Sphingomonadales bacterium]
MATIAQPRTGRTATAIVMLLGTAIFLNYVDRGSLPTAAPVLKGSLKLSNEDYGLAISAFFWIYAPIQLFAGWLCDRFSVYKLLAAGILIWALSTLLMGFAGGFLSLFVLRIMLGIGESLAFPGSSKIIARHVPAERRGVANSALAMGIAFGPAVGTLAGGLMVATWGWRAMFFVFGAVTLLWLVPWTQLVRSLPKGTHEHREPRVAASMLLRKWPLWSMSIVHMLGNYCFYFLLAWLPLFLTESRGFSKTEWVYIAAIGYTVQGVCAFAYGHLTDWWTRSGRSEAFCRRWMMVASQSLVAVAIFGLAFAHSALSITILLCLAGAATAALSMNLYAIAQMFAGPRAAGSWVGFQNALGNSSGIFGPIVSAYVVTHAGYDAAFYLTAAVGVVGAIWWAVGVPKIEQVDLD